MAWTSTQFFTALAAEWYAQRRATQHTAHIDVSPSSGLPGSGVAHRDMRFVNIAGSVKRTDSNIVLQEVADLYKSWNASPTEEAFEDHLAISAGQWWWCAIEVKAVPSGAANIALRWLEPDSGGPTKETTKSVTPGATTALTADAILTQLETITQDTNAEFKVVNGRGAMFHAWVTTGGSGSYSTVMIAASSSRQTFARVTSTFGTSDIDVTYTYGVSEGSLLTNKIRDLRYPWTTGMTSSQIATVAMANAASGTTAAIPTREDLDVQEALFRSSTGSNMSSSGKVLHSEVIAPAVLRTCIIEINHSDFSSASGTISRSINLAFPFNDRLGFDYYAEGPVILKDAFIEHHTPFQVASSSSEAGVYPSVILDVGTSTPTGLGGRVKKSAILRNCRVTPNVTQGWNQGAGFEHLNTLAPAAENYHGAVTTALADGASAWFNWGETHTYPTSDFHTGSGTIPSYLTFTEPFVITAMTFELPSATAYTYNASHKVAFQICVCPKGTSPIEANFVPLSTYFDLTAEPYGNANWPTATYTPASLAVSTQVSTVLGILIPSGWKIALKCTATGTVITRGWTVRAFGHVHRGQGTLMQSPNSTTMIDPWSDRSDTLTATLSLEKKVEVQVGSGVTEAGGTTYDLASLDQGKCFLHLHFWQVRRSAAAQAKTYSASNP
jgi:hypothetical protein